MVQVGQVGHGISTAFPLASSEVPYQPATLHRRVRTFATSILIIFGSIYTEKIRTCICEDTQELP